MKKSNSKLPKGVYRDRSRYAYKPYLGKVNGKTKWGKPVRLAALDAPLSEVWKAYELITGRRTDTLKWLLTEYNQSAAFQDCAPVTQAHYEKYFKAITEQKTQSGKLFGDYELTLITRKVIQRYLDKTTAKVAANRRIQYVKAAWNWGINRLDEVPEPNPCIGVHLNKERPRDKYVTPEEYLKVYQAALSMRNPMFAHALELAYLCRARRGEVFSMTLDNILEDGLLLDRAKGSKSDVILWSPRLKQAVEGCKTIYPNAPTPIMGAYLLHGKNGKQYAESALNSAWQRVMKKAKEQFGLTSHFTFHDIKACGCTDSDLENAGGHKSKKMAAIYDRLPGKKEATK